MNGLCAICDSAIPATSRGITCSFVCRALLREQRKTVEWRTPREYPAELVDRVRSLYVDRGMTIAEVQAVVGRGVKVQRVMENHDIARRPTIKRDQRGPKNDSWRGDSPSYAAAHTRVYAQRGSAADYRCMDCDKPAEQWAYDGHCPREQEDGRGRIYSPDPTQYSPRCTPCHMRQDRDRDTCGRFVRKEEMRHGA